MRILLVAAVTMLLIDPALVRAAAIDAAALFRQLDADRDGQVTGAEAGGERALLYQRLLRTGDENNDGLLSAAELAIALQPVRAEKAPVPKRGSRLPGADALVVLLAGMDVNGDGRFEPEEAPRRYRRTLEQMVRIADEDRDGALDSREVARAAPRLSMQAPTAAARLGLNVQEELGRLPPGSARAIEQLGDYQNRAELLADPQEAARLFERLDGDADGRLSIGEAPPQLAERFPQILRRVDRDGDRQLDREEFIDVARRIARRQGPPADLAKDRQSKRAGLGSAPSD